MLSQSRTQVNQELPKSAGTGMYGQHAMLVMVARTRQVGGPCSPSAPQKASCIAGLQDRVQLVITACEIGLVPAAHQAKPSVSDL